MNDAPLSVLLLAWDEADPAPGALGAALPASAALRAGLAAQVPLTAILPQHPLGEAAPAPITPAAMAPPASPTPAFDEVLLKADVLPGAAPGSTPEVEFTADFSVAAAAALTPLPAAPVLIGLADWTLAELNAEALRRGGGALGFYAGGEWHHPAAPYVGSSAAEIRPNSISLAPTAPEASKAGQPADFSALNAVFSGAGGAVLAALLAAASIARSLESADNYSAEAYSLPATPPPLMPDPATGLPIAEEPAFDLPADPGPAEAAALRADAADPEPELARPAALAALRRRAPTAASALAGASKAEVSAPGEVLALAASLSFRVIQYARFATQLTAGGTGFSVVLALAWPTWLAAVEIRQRTGRPLVLYVTELPSEQAPPAVRGWLRELERQAFQRADLVLVPTAALAGQLQARFPQRPVPRVLLAALPATTNPVLTPDLPDLLALTAAVLAQLQAAAGASA